MPDAEVMPATEVRVELGTDEEIRRRTRRELEARVSYYAQHPEEIDGRLDELDREWDVERLLEVNAGAFTLVGMTLGVAHRRWLLLPGAVGVFLIQHALRGWCSPMSVFRRLGIRLADEINHERFALKALRGDFNEVHIGEQQDPHERARRAIQAADQYL